MTYDGDNVVTMWIPARLFHDCRTRGHRLGPHHPQLKLFQPKGISKLGAQFLLNLPRHHSFIPFLLGKSLLSFISTGQWEPLPASHMECPVLQMQGFPYSLPVKDFQLCQLILRELQLSYPAAILPFHPLVVGPCQ